MEKLQNAQQIVAQAEERQRAFENLETSWAERVVAFEEEKDILMKQIEELKTSEWHVSIVQELDAVKLEIETVKAGKRELESTVAVSTKEREIRFFSISYKTNLISHIT